MEHKTLRNAILAVVVLFLCLFAYSYLPTVEVETINSGENAVRLALVSDLHACYYGENQHTLVEMLDESRPDAVFLTGDIFDDQIPDDNAMRFLEQIAPKYPCFYVSGNHEQGSGRIAQMKNALRSLNIEVLEGNCGAIALKNRAIDVCGVDDPSAVGEKNWKSQLERAYASTTPGHEKILLSHRSERVAFYTRYDFDLVLSGHAHGGQWLIPIWNRGLLGANRTLFANYVNGRYDLSAKTKMVVSRGLARESTLFPRLFNRPEIVIVEF